MFFFLRLERGEYRLEIIDNRVEERFKTYSLLSTLYSIISTLCSMLYALVAFKGLKMPLAFLLL
jgi:hypothetical protein